MNTQHPDIQTCYTGILLTTLTDVWFGCLGVMCSCIFVYKVTHIFMPRCTVHIASEVCGSVFVCLCVCVCKSATAAQR